MSWKEFFKSGPLVAITLSVFSLLITLLSVVYRLEGRLDGLERDITNHIPSQINKLEKDLKENIKRAEDKLKEDIKRVEDKLKEGIKGVEDKIDRLIDRLDK